MNKLDLKLDISIIYSMTNNNNNNVLFFLCGRGVNRAFSWVLGKVGNPPEQLAKLLENKSNNILILSLCSKQLANDNRTKKRFEASSFHQLIQLPKPYSPHCSKLILIPKVHIGFADFSYLHYYIQAYD